jgi:hypothetical protein
MEEKLIEHKQEAASVEHKVYTPPTLTVYGKLTDLTAGGSTGPSELGSNAQNKVRS